MLHQVDRQFRAAASTWRSRTSSRGRRRHGQARKRALFLPVDGQHQRLQAARSSTRSASAKSPTIVWGDQQAHARPRPARFDYSWADDGGNVYQASEPFRDRHLPGGHRGAGRWPNAATAFGGSPEALRYQDVRFPIGQHDYAVDMPVRGNKNLSELHRTAEDVGRRCRRSTSFSVARTSPTAASAKQAGEPVLLPAEAVGLRFSGRARGLLSAGRGGLLTPGNMALAGRSHDQQTGAARSDPAARPHVAVIGPS